MKGLSAVTALMICTALFETAHAQSNQRPDRTLIAQAEAIVVDSVFTRLAGGLADELAEWIVDQVHTEASGSTRSQQLNQFQSQLRMIVQDGPNSPFGRMDGYDLLQETALRGTSRYFRLTYMTYHQHVPLVWEFHFYVRPDRSLSLAVINFNGQNPFNYMSTPDMLIDQFYSSY